MARGNDGRSNRTVVSVEATNKVNKPVKDKWASKHQLSPEWFVQYPSLATVSISTFMPYSSLGTVLYSTAVGWRPAHVNQQRVIMSMGNITEARQLAVAELFNDMRANLKSNLAYTRNDIAAYVEWAIFTRAVAKSAECYYRIGLTATADDPTFAAALAGAKFGFTSQENFLNDYETYAPQIKLALDNFATWMIEHVRVHCKKISVLDYLMNVGFLEEEVDSAPLDVFSLQTKVVAESGSTLILTEPNVTTGAYFLNLFTQIQANWSEKFTIITADIQNCYGDRLNQAWDFTLKNYTYNAVYDPDIKQKLKNAVIPIQMILQNVNGTLTEVTASVETSDVISHSYGTYYTGSDQLTMVFNINATAGSVIIADRNLVGGFFSAQKPTGSDATSVAAPRQYLVSVPYKKLDPGQAVEISEHMMTYDIVWDKGDNTIRIPYNNGPFLVAATNSVVVLPNGNIQKTVVRCNVARQSDKLNTIPSIVLNNSWCEAMPLSSVILAQSASTFYQFGNVAYDDVTVIPDINLNQLRYAETASIYRTIKGAIS